MMSIHTVAAGGGSILHFDGARLSVGPDSAARIRARVLPARRTADSDRLQCDGGKDSAGIFSQGVRADTANEALDDEVVREKFAALAMEVEEATGRALTPEQLADGYLDIAVGNMAEAIKRISIQRGHDVTQYTLSVFGGAGGQHACRVADALGMTRIFVHPLAGVLSAYGMGLADQTAMREQSIERRLRPDAMATLSDGTRSPGGRCNARSRIARRAGRAHRRREARTFALRRHRLGADCRRRNDCRDAGCVRCRVSEALFVPDAAARADHRSSIGRGDRQRRDGR